MKASNLLMPTLREVPSEAEITSHKLMLRAGLIRKLAAGVYSYLPLGLKALRKIEAIVREEMDAAGAQELLMSALLPSQAYEASGRWDKFGAEMFRLKDRKGANYCLGPTHEEIFTSTVLENVHSYKDFPMTLYQIQTKYRDEIRPRFGVMRTREFIMKDAYSFDIDEAGLDASYQAMYKAYRKIFDRLGLRYMVVDADSGAMGGSGSQEFMVLSEVGEDTLCYCDACHYAANVEKAACTAAPCEKGEEKALCKIETPEAKTIEDLVAFFGTTPDKFAKTLIYRADEKLVAVMVRGDRQINEIKLKNFLGADELALADNAAVEDATGAAVGFAGPIGLGVDVYCDNEVAQMQNFIVGANETGFHFENANIGRDFTPKAVCDLRMIEEGDPCPKCGQPVKTAQGVEVGHIFKLGTKYSDALGLSFANPATGEEKSIIMGCYGIGVNRVIAAIIEQGSDENGIIWPVSAAPYEVCVVPVKAADEAQMKLAQDIYEQLKAQNIDVLLDDRDERVGVKFKDMDLIGVPVRITVGKKASEGVVEFKLRTDEKSADMTVSEALGAAVAFVQNGR